MNEINLDRADTQVRRVIRAITDHMRGNQLRVGDSLPSEAFFAEELGVSKTVTREAFAAMSAMKLLDVGNGRRARVGAINGTMIATSLEHGISTSQISFADVWQVRQTIERTTTALAAQNRTAAEAAEIVRLAEMLSLERHDVGQTTNHDIAFHTAIAIASHNKLFVQIVTSFAPMMEQAVPIAWRTRKTEALRDDMVMHHRAIAAAIAAQDPEAATAAIHRHFDSTIGDVLTSMSDKA